MKGVAPINWANTYYAVFCGGFKGYWGYRSHSGKSSGSIVFDHDQDGAVEETVQALLKSYFWLSRSKSQGGCAYFSLAEVRHPTRALNRIVWKYATLPNIQGKGPAAVYGAFNTFRVWKIRGWSFIFGLVWRCLHSKNTVAGSPFCKW